MSMPVMQTLLLGELKDFSLGRARKRAYTARTGTTAVLMYRVKHVLQYADHSPIVGFGQIVPTGNTANNTATQTPIGHRS